MTRAAESNLLGRIYSAWKDGRLDLAEIHIRDLNAQVPFPNPLLCQKLVATQYEIGKNQLSHNNVASATQWLKRALELVDRHYDDVAQFEDGEMRLNLLHTYARSLMALDQVDTKREVTEVLRTLRKDYGHKLAVMVLQLEIHHQSSPKDLGQYVTDLNGIAKSMHLIESNHKIFMHYLHDIAHWSLTDAYDILFSYIISRLMPDDGQQYLDDAVLTLIWMSSSISSQARETSQSNRLTQLLRVAGTSERSLTSNVADSSLTIIWKLIQSAATQQRYSDAASWCCLASACWFRNGNTLFLDRIGRRLVSVHLQSSEIGRASDALKSLSSTAKEHAVTRFLGYCCAIRLRNDDYVKSSINSLFNLPNLDKSFALACLAEAHLHGTKWHNVLILQRILDKYQTSVCKELNRVTLLRHAVKNLVSIFQESTCLDEELLARALGIFRTVAKFVIPPSATSPASASLLREDEAQWFVGAGLKIALQNMVKCPHTFTIDILYYAQRIAKLLSNFNCSLQAKCIFASTLIYVWETRQWKPDWTVHSLPQTSFSKCKATAITDTKAILFNNVFNHFTELRGLVEETRSLPQIKVADVTDDLLSKYIMLLPFAFEAILYLITVENTTILAHRDLSAKSDSESTTENYTDSQLMGAKFPRDSTSLCALVDAAREVKAPNETFMLIADQILVAIQTQDDLTPKSKGIPFCIAVSTLGRLVQVTRDQPDFSITKSARWIRCVTELLKTRVDSDLARQFISGNEEHLSNIALIVEEAITLAKMAFERCNVKINSSREHFQDPAIRMQTDVMLNDFIDDDLFNDIDEPITAEEMIKEIEMAENGHAQKPTDQKISENTHTPLDLTDELYPNDELEWLSTTLFNLAIDLHMIIEKATPVHLTSHASIQSCRPEFWVQKAIQLADNLAQNEDLILKHTMRNSEGTFIGQSSDIVMAEDTAVPTTGRLAAILREKCELIGWPSVIQC